jgi:UDP-N-acetylmuramyl pentapeptide phosphotransferase/UDP-N-acetylglucosamine-1-phosphate transferase
MLYHPQNKNEQMSKFTLITIFALVFILHLYDDKMYNGKYHLAGIPHLYGFLVFFALGLSKNVWMRLSANSMMIAFLVIYGLFILLFKTE